MWNPFRKAKSPTKEQGVSGTELIGGYVVTDEADARLTGQNRYRTAADILANVSIVAASTRFFLNLLAKPKWNVESVDDSQQAKNHAEFVESVINDLDVSWARVVRRSGLFRFHGFGIQEWTAKKRPDGMIGFKSIEPRPQHTIERWDVDDNGNVKGVWQRSPVSGRELFIERDKFVYFVDDTLTDNPEGMGWFRHLVEPAERLKNLLSLEKIGYERDLSGVPVGKAPITAINRAVKNGTLSSSQANSILEGIKNFVQLEIKKKNTGIVLDSQTFEDTTSDGTRTSGVNQWGLELLTSQAGSMEQILKSIQRLNMEMALIIGTENILTGTDGVGSLALSKDKSNNLYLQISSTLGEMTEIFTNDLVKPLWRLNGLPDNMMPKLQAEDVAFKDIEVMAKVLRDMATAGAVLAPDDPAIDDLRTLLGVSPQ